MQVAVRLGRESCNDALVLAGFEIGLNHVGYEVLPRSCFRGLGLPILN
jgi:hypothetical protein